MHVSLSALWGVSPVGIRAVKVVVAVRPKAYPYRRDANWVHHFNPKKKKWEWVKTDDPVGVEIAREVVACPGCASVPTGEPTGGKSPT